MVYSRLYTIKNKGDQLIDVYYIKNDDGRLITNGTGLFFDKIIQPVS